MQTARIAIVGGGLSGLYAAYLLQQRGIREYVLLEARERFGGRVASAAESLDLGDRFDLGATWFWPAFQPQLQRLVDELGLERFEQFEAGDMLLERSRTAPPMRAPGYVSSPTSMRLTGGMSALI